MIKLAAFDLGVCQVKCVNFFDFLSAVKLTAECFT